LQKEKTRINKNKSSFKRLSTAIKCGANLLPVVTMIYSMQHAKKSSYILETSNPIIRMSLQDMNEKIIMLKTTAKNLQKMKDIDDDELYKIIYNATTSYVNLFYHMSEDAIDNYIINSEGHITKNINRENNLLLIPAILAARGEPSSDVINFITNNVYKVPFKILYHSSKAALHIELLEQSMGIKTISIQTLNNLNLLLQQLEKRTKEIEEGNIRLDENTLLKEKFIESIIEISYGKDLNIPEFISEKIMPNAFIERTTKKLIRKI
jgi:hypothetical protein